MFEVIYNTAPMKKKLPFNANAIFALLFFFGFFANFVQTATVFIDDYATSASTEYTAATGTIGINTLWNVNRNGSDCGARITTGIKTLINDA